MIHKWLFQWINVNTVQFSIFMVLFHFFANSDDCFFLGLWSLTSADDGTKFSRPTSASSQTPGSANWSGRIPSMKYSYVLHITYDIRTYTSKFYFDPSRASVMDLLMAKSQNSSSTEIGIASTGSYKRIKLWHFTQKRLKSETRQYWVLFLL